MKLKERGWRGGLWRRRISMRRGISSLRKSMRLSLMKWLLCMKKR
jgi:hypothetical protein